ncbi:relA-associated inhibitor-like [Mantella aurantiaca]
MEVLLRPRTKLIGWRDFACKMASDPGKTSDPLMDLNFQSLAARELNAKQMELDSATAKLDELRRELEKRRSPGKGEVRGKSSWSLIGCGRSPSPCADLSRFSPQNVELFVAQNSAPALSPSLARRSQSASALSSLATASSQQSNWPRAQDSSPISAPMTSSSLSVTSSSAVPVLSLSPSPTLTRRSLPPDNSGPPRSPWGRPSSPRPQYYERPLPPPSSPRLSSGSYEYSAGVRSVSPSPEGQLPLQRYSDWTPPTRQPAAYEVPLGFAPPRFSDDVSSMRRRPQRSWNESDLDMMYDKKPPQDITGLLIIDGY